MRNLMDLKACYLGSNVEGNTTCRRDWLTEVETWEGKWRLVCLFHLPILATIAPVKVRACLYGDDK